MKLVIAEKPSVAMQIAQVVGAKEKKYGYMQGSGYIVSWCIGHLVELSTAEHYDGKFSKWRHDDLPIIPAQWQYSIARDKEKQMGIVKKLMLSSDVSSIICATDAGREGELIFRLVYEFCQCHKPVERLWISSMEESAIQKGLETIKDAKDYDSLYQAALCRAQADWLIGINVTRLFSILYGETLNVGRVMTPTLTLITKREKDIQTFQAKAYFIPQIHIDTVGAPFVAKGTRMDLADTANAVRGACHGQSATVASVKKQQKKITPPKLYDLTALQREANRMYGFTAQQTLDYLQSLYEKKIVTYPRTDSRYLTQDMYESTSTVISDLAGAYKISVTPNLSQVINDAKVSDHHAIVPTCFSTQTDISALPKSEQQIFLLVACRLLCAVAQAQECEMTEAEINCNGYDFIAKGKNVIQSGWKEIEQSLLGAQEHNNDEPALPELLENYVFPAVKASVFEGKTTAPKAFTEDTLLSAMEHASKNDNDINDDLPAIGLGTPATRAGTIEKLVKIGFVERRNKKLFPTQKGINLIDVLPEQVKSPILTAQWESELAKIERGESDSKTFMNGIHDLLENLIISSQASPAHKYLFGVDGVQETIGVCPRCGAPVHERKKGFFCSCKDCQFALWKDNKFFSSKKKKLDKKMAAALLKDGRVFLSDLFSEKTGRNYDASILMQDSGEGHVNFALKFPEKRKKNDPS